MVISKVTTLLFLANITLFGVLDRIQRAMEKGDYSKAKELIEKGYEKEPDNPGLYFQHALLLFTKTYKGFNVDSARILISESIRFHELASDDLLKEIQEDQVDSSTIHSLFSRIQQFQLSQTKSNLSIGSIADFRSKYPNSIFEDELIFKRDSIAFNFSRAEHTKDGYANYMRKYPNSVFVPTADSLLDQLRFLDLRNSGGLREYVKFRSQYPNSNRLREVEEYILQIATSSHQSEDFVTFINSARTAHLKKKAADVLYYLDRTSTDSHPLKDSLRSILRTSNAEIFPVMDQSKFGFRSIDNFVQISPSFEGIQPGIKCALSNDDWIFVRGSESGMIIQKNGNLVLRNVDDYSSLSASIALVKKNNYSFLYHKSGFRILKDPIEHAEVFTNDWIKVKRNNKWGLYTMLGLSIADIRYEEISRIGPFWVFERGGLLAVYTSRQILSEVEEEGLSLEFRFDDLELLSDGLLIGFRENRECLLNQNLEFVIPWGEYEIHPVDDGWYLHSPEGYYLFNNTDNRIIDRKYPYLETNEGWLALKTENDWILISKHGASEPNRGYDSIKLISPNAALVFTQNKRSLTFHNSSKIDLTEHEILSFPSRPEFLMIKKQGSLGLYDKNGEAVFDGKYDDLSFVNDTLLKVSVKGKQGLISSNGGFVLNPIFDSLSEKDKLILTLYKGRIGCYDLSTKVLIPPNYDARIVKIGDHYLVKSDQKYGLVDANNEEVMGFNFESIEQWNDTSYLVSQNGIKSLRNQDEKVLVDQLENIDMVYQDEDEKIFRVLLNGKFGLLSSTNGTILNPEFTDILNIGRPDKPLFFADQHLSSAGYHVVSYVNKMGELVFSKAYRREEFDQIICED